jgi:hypothetical protein
MMHFNDSDGRAYPSLETITKLCGLARRTVRDMIDLLLADDNIRIVEKGEPGRGHPTIYAIVVKPLPDDVAEARRRVALREDRRKRNGGKSAIIADCDKLPTVGNLPSAEVLAVDAGALEGSVHAILDTGTVAQKASRYAILDTGPPFPLRHEPSLPEERDRYISPDTPSLWRGLTYPLSPRGMRSPSR